MSALPPKAAALCQKRTHAPQQTASLFDPLVGPLLEEPRHVEAECADRNWVIVISPNISAPLSKVSGAILILRELIESDDSAPKITEAALEDPLKQAKAKAAATYDAAADHFDDEPLHFWERIGTRTVARLGLLAGARVLDVGCGTGASALPAAQAVGRDGFVVGVDLSMRLLDRARTKAMACGLTNVEFRVADMTALGYEDGRFDAVVSVFSIFFVPDMEGLVRELWRMVRPSGKLAVTTWGPRIFEPAYSRWLAAIKKERPDLHTAFNPWDRITDVEAVRKLLHDGGVTDSEVTAEDGSQPLRSAEDWWIIALGSGLRWTIDQMGPEAAARVRADNVHWLRTNKVGSVETNAIYAIATKPF